MKKKAPLIAAGLIFEIIMLIHLYRLYAGFDVIIAGYSMPMWASIVGVIISGLLSVWMFSAAFGRNCGKPC